MKALAAFFLAVLALPAAEPVRQTWTIDGVEREALVHVPAAGAKSDPAPLIFFFHGRSGKMADTARRHALHTHWPEAVVVFPQGLPTPALKGKGDNLQPGWQVVPGQYADRDLRFFDAMLASLKKDHRIDDRRIYVTGTSNGGGMTFLLWGERGSVFAAVAPTCTAARALSATQTEAALRRLPHLPSFHAAGEKDTTIPIADQLATITLIRESRSLGAGTPWGQPPERFSTFYPSKTGAPLVTYLYPGGHGLPSDVSPILVKFFQQHRRP